MLYMTCKTEGIRLRPNVYVLYYEKLPHDRHNAFTSVKLLDIPKDEACFTTESGISIRYEQSPWAENRAVILEGLSQAIIELASGWPASLARWRQQLHEALWRAGARMPEEPLQVGKWQLPWHRRTLVMGILNMTPDSFSDGGEYLAVEDAVARALALQDAGADIIDIGGESTRPPGVYAEGADYVPAEVEKARVLPIIARLAAQLDIPISIDTYKAEVAEAAIQTGAHMVNDVWGLKRDPQMADVIARFDVPVVLMHNRKRVHYEGPLLQEIVNDLWESVALARNAGVRDERIILDPGIGFAKTYAHNVEVMRHLEQVSYMGFPILLGTSRKSLIGKTLNLPVDERVEGTGATVAVGIAKGCQVVRVHDVQQIVRVCRMTDTILRPGRKEATPHG